MSFNSDLKGFWASILAFLESDRPVATKHQVLKRAADVAQRAMLFENERMALTADDPAHQGYWARMREFFEHPDVAESWTVETTIDQLTRVARGERGVGIHDNCVALPLYS